MTIMPTGCIVNVGVPAGHHSCPPVPSHRAARTSAAAALAPPLSSRSAAAAARARRRRPGAQPLPARGPCSLRQPGGPAARFRRGGGERINAMNRLKVELLHATKS